MIATVMDALDEAARKWGSQPALRVKRGGAWRTTTFTEYRENVRRTARAFMALGLAPGQGVSIIGYNRPEWFYADVGAIFAGGVPAGIYTTSSPEQCQYITDHCDAAVVVVEDEAQLAKLQQVRAQLPKLRAIVLMDGSDPDPFVLSWEELWARAAEVSDADLDARIAAQEPSGLCTLIYTSGTTGPPKAVMISHENVCWTARALLSQLDVHPGDEVVSYLPLSHIAEQVVSLHGPMAFGGCTWFAESLDKLGDNLKEVRPHLFLGVPRVWEKIQAKMAAAGASAPPLRKKLVAYAKKVGMAAMRADQEGRRRPLLYPLFERLVFSKVRQALGLDRCRMQVTSAAPISRDTLEFFLALGIPLFEVYGMSECTGPATISVPGRYQTGKAGFCLPGAELKIAADGEVCMRGKHVCQGYLKNPEATAETIDADGWLHSGDIGTIDERGLLQITDRKKDLIITAGGENIAPQVIEGMLRAIPGIAQAVVVGDRMRYLAALFTLDPEKLPLALAAAGSPAKGIADAATCPKLHAWLDKQIAGVNHHLARVQTVKRWKLLSVEFTIDGGELTPTMKLKRKAIREKFAAEIAALYQDADAA